MSAAARSSLAALALATACLLGGCASATPTPSPTPTPTPVPTVTPAPSPTPTPSPTPSPTQPAANIPSDCADVGGDAAADAVGDMTLVGDGTGFTRPAPDGATLALGCEWMLGDDITGMLLLISTADPGAVSTAEAGLSSEGYTCSVSDDFGADFCDLPDANGAANTEQMIVASGGTWIYLSTSNRNGRAFLSAIASQVLG